jgi:hypothetical protein
LLLARKPAAFLVINSPPPLTKDSATVKATETAVSEDITIRPSINNEIPWGEKSPAVDNQEIDEPVDSSKRKWRPFDIPGDVGEEVEGFQRPGRQSQQSNRAQVPDPDLETEPRNSLNPWVIAKMTVPVQQRSQSTNPAANISYPASQPTADALPTLRHSSNPVESDLSIQFQGKPSRPRQTVRSDDIRSLVVQHMQYPSYKRPKSATIQHVNFQPSRRQLTADADDEVLLDGDDSGTRRRKNDFVSARTISDVTLLSPPATIRPRSRDVNRPFVPPTRTTETSLLHDGLRQTKLIDDCRASQGPKGVYQNPTEPQPSSDLEWSMDFEHRKELVTRWRRNELRASTLEVDGSDIRQTVRTSPHKNRYNAAIATLKANHVSPNKIETVKEPLKTSLPDGDPRAYLMRRQRSVMSQKAKFGEAPKITRVKSNRLPLENVPENEQTHNLVQELSTDMRSLRRIMVELMKSDMYVKKGNDALGLRIGGLEATRVASRVKAAVTKWMESEGNQNCDVEYNFENLVTIDLL